MSEPSQVKLARLESPFSLMRKVSPHCCCSVCVVGSSPSASSASTSVQPNQTLLPGEVSAGVGDLPGASSEAAVAVPPDVKGESALEKSYFYRSLTVQPPKAPPEASSLSQIPSHPTELSKAQPEHRTWHLLSLRPNLERALAKALRTPPSSPVPTQTPSRPRRRPHHQSP